jgi:hypothetical protein
MSKREIVVLVSRALAVIQIMSALLEMSYLPERVIIFAHRITLSRFLGLSSIYEIEATLALILRITVLLLAAYLLWKCGPKIERFLLPPSSGIEISSPADGGVSAA